MRQHFQFGQPRFYLFLGAVDVLVDVQSHALALERRGLELEEDAF